MPRVPVFNQMNLAHAKLSYLFKIHFNITLPSMPGSSESSSSFRFLYLNSVCIFLLHHTRRATWPAQLITLDLITLIIFGADPGGRAVWGVGLRPLDGWDRRFEFCWRLAHCVRSVLCRQRPVRRADHSIRGVLPGVCLIVCVLETSTMRRPRPDLGCCGTEKNWWGV